MQGRILRPSGRLDIATSAAFECDVQAAIDAGSPWLVLDFSDVLHVSSVGVRVVMMAAKRLRAAGGRVAVCGMQTPIADVIEVSGLNPILEIYADRASALAALP
jgi:anti-anti-sigma factor